MADNNISRDYFKLFTRREGKVVLGKNASNFWLLCAVLISTFLAIGFSNASLDYLSFKMNDPFINWVDIKNNFAENDFDGFESALENEDDLKERFHFNGFQTDKYWYTAFFTSTDDAKNLKCRYFEDISTPLVSAIMDGDNVISDYCIDPESRNNQSFGVIITYDALINKLGYKSVPDYVNYYGYCDPEAEEDFGVTLYEENYAKVPIPILAVVKRLPTNMDIIGTKHFYHQNLALSLNLYNASYASSLIYYSPDKSTASKIVADLESMASDMIEEDLYSIQEDAYYPLISGYGKGTFVSLSYYDEEDADYDIVSEINSRILDEYASKDVIRVYDYEENETFSDADDYISVHFDDLDAIRSFQEFAKDEYQIDIEMTQINAKENFHEVSVMANILSWTMIVFAIVCIILFIVNLLQSYFQKVKRNLGTFKAFGMGNRQLMDVYILIMTAIIVSAIVASLSATVIVQWMLPVFGILKDGVFNYIDLWSLKTIASVVIIIVASVCTVRVVMGRLLKDTPGDLIYDR